MDWRARLAAIVVAGGVSGCDLYFTHGGGPPACNANPDPCCAAPDSQACKDKTACEAHPTETCCEQFSFSVEQCAYLPDLDAGRPPDAPIIDDAYIPPDASIDGG